jgi:hypothetical protein
MSFVLVRADVATSVQTSFGNYISSVSFVTLSSEAPDTFSAACAKATSASKSQLDHDDRLGRSTYSVNVEELHCEATHN